MNTFKLNKPDGSAIELSLPSKWDELNKVELLYIGNNWQKWMELAQNKEDLNKAKVYLLLSLMRCSGKKKVEIVKYVADMNDDEILKMCRLIDFVFEDCTLTNQLVPVVKSFFKELYGPAAKLSNLTFGEFIFTEKYFENYFKHKKPIDLVKIAAVLYRPIVSKKHKARVAFDNRFDFNANVKLVNEIVSIGELNAIFLMYLGCHKMFEQLYKGVFGGKGGNSKNIANYGLMNVAFGLADMGGLGNINDIQALNVHVVLQRWEVLLNTQAEAEKNG
jgi:hypothetical protein